jgi:uncharacterized protein (DUF58 family)
MSDFLRRAWPLTARGTGALALAIACFVVAHEAGLVELVYFGMLLVVALAASLASLWLTRRVDSVTRSLTPDVATVGRESIVTVRIGIRSALPTSAATWDDAVSGGLGARARGEFPALGSALRGGERVVELRYPLVGRARGVHTLGPFGLTATDPFGLARRRVRLGGKTDVTVAPRIIELPSLPLAAGESGGMLQTVIAQLGQGADNLVARPYAPGDSMRRVHWRATAHRDTLMVRQEEQEASPEATVVLDRNEARWSAEAREAPGADPGFEAAVSAAVSVVGRLVRDGFSVTLVDSDGHPLADPIPGGEVPEVDTLARELATPTTRPGSGLAQLGAALDSGRTGPVVIVTGRLFPGDVEALAPLAHRSSLPVLISTAPSYGTLAQLGAHGVHAVAAPVEADLAEVWADALERTVGHVVG